MPSSAFQTCARSEEHTSELQSHDNLVCRLLLGKKKNKGELDAVRNVCCWRIARTTLRRSHDSALSHSSPSFIETLQPHAPNYVFFFFFNDTATTEISPLSLHDALPICLVLHARAGSPRVRPLARFSIWRRQGLRSEEHTSELPSHDNLVCRLLLEK